MNTITEFEENDDEDADYQPSEQEDFEFEAEELFSDNEQQNFSQTQFIHSNNYNQNNSFENLQNFEFNNNNNNFILYNNNLESFGTCTRSRTNPEYLKRYLELSEQIEKIEQQFSGYSADFEFDESFLEYWAFLHSLKDQAQMSIFGNDEENDEENDGDYYDYEEALNEDKEEYRNDRAVHVSQKEIQLLSIDEINQISNHNHDQIPNQISNQIPNQTSNQISDVNILSKDKKTNKRIKRKNELQIYKDL
eukprot:TRINITY_DN1615_c0_g2_i5.p1 TRINITY_DN1615_c0_g2~~TRINITY_DN1615_c0_g2_i5.p1  ORF type:complete len:250 (+),score=109.41 TRINITY_DN1615_c0_g2_i5:52-801(+)